MVAPRAAFFRRRRFAKSDTGVPTDIMFYNDSASTVYYRVQYLNWESQYVAFAAGAPVLPGASVNVYPAAQAFETGVGPVPANLALYTTAIEDSFSPPDYGELQLYPPSNAIRLTAGFSLVRDPLGYTLPTGPTVTGPVTAVRDPGTPSMATVTAVGLAAAYPSDTIIMAVGGNMFLTGSVSGANMVYAGYISVAEFATNCYFYRKLAPACYTQPTIVSVDFGDNPEF